MAYGRVNVCGNSNIIKSRQRGVASYQGYTNNIQFNINPVDVNSSILIVNDVAFNLSPNYNSSIEFLNNSKLMISRGKYADAPNYSDVNWEVIEFQNIKSLQKIKTSFSGSEKTININKVNLEKSFIVGDFKTEYSSGGSEYSFTFINDISIQIKTQTSSSSSYPFEFSIYVIELN